MSAPGTKQRLGRGLASLLGDASGASADSPVGDIATDRLDANPYQPRAAIQQSDLVELAASIASAGLLQPLLVRPHPSQAGRYQIIAGERRWRAAQIAGLDKVPCFVRELTEGEVAIAALVENLQRRDLNAIEEAEGFSALTRGFSMTHEQLAAAVGKSRSHVANVLRLLNLPNEVLDHVRSGALSAGHARAALSCADPLSAAITMIRDGLSVRQAEQLRTLDDTQPPTKPSPADRHSDPDREAVEADLAEKLGVAVEISFNGRSGTMKLRYQTLEQLDYIVAKLGS